MTTFPAKNRPDHIWHEGDTVISDGDPFIVVKVEPLLPCDMILDWNQMVEYERVTVTLERFDGNPA